MTNGEVVNRQWLSYSPSTGDVFCVPCKVFGHVKTAFTSGFSDWKHCHARVSEHENSDYHKAAVTTWVSRANAAGRIDKELVKQLAAETVYWRNVLHRVIETVKFIAERGLAYRGDDERFGSSTNGNFMSILELLSKFDPFLSEHIAKFGSCGRGVASYLSKTTCEQVIQLMGKKVEKTILDEIKKAKYFAISVDSTPDLSHVDQLTLIVRYVKENGKPIERFLKFIEMHDHGAEGMTTLILNTLDELGLNIQDCRGQSYDNAANMSGVYTGLQARVKAVNPLAHFVPCTAHSLNLVGVAAAGSCLEAVSYFGFLQSLYNFLSASTYRWNRLKLALPKGGTVVKTLSDTRWSARADAVKAVFANYMEIQTALNEISSDNKQNLETRVQAEALVSKMSKIETALMTVIWHAVLERFNATSMSLQQNGIDLLSAVQLYKSLVDFIVSLRETFDDVEETAKRFVTHTEYKQDTSRKRKRKNFFDDGNSISPTDTVQLTAREQFRISSFYVILDSLTVELRKRLEAYSNLHTLFGFLTEFRSMNDEEVKACASNLVKTYPNDIDQAFVDEFSQFTSVAAEAVPLPQGSTDDDHTVASSSADTLRFSELLNDRQGLLLSTFPNVGIVLRLYLTLPVSNCEGERSFSTLSRIKNHLRSSMCQDRLTALSLLSIESELMQSLDYNDIIDDFARDHARRRAF